MRPSVEVTFHASVYDQLYDVEVDAEITARVGAFYPGVFSAPAERCRPDEGGECEAITAIDAETGEDITDRLTEAQVEALMLRAQKEAPDRAVQEQYERADREIDRRLEERR